MEKIIIDWIEQVCQIWSFYKPSLKYFLFFRKENIIHNNSQVVVFTAIPCSDANLVDIPTVL